jgi:Tol biopolymer transport system component
MNQKGGRIMKRIRNYFIVVVALSMVALCPISPDRARAADEDKDVVTEWYSYVDGRIALNTSHDPEPVYFTDPALDDYKPTPSPDGSQIAFFRAIDYGNGQDITWKTKICVMNADGTNLRELTGGDYMDTNPMWTRDGSNKIMWTRMEGQTTALKWLVGSAIPLGMNIYWTSPDAEPGDEVKISKSDLGHYMNFVYSGLKDGRVLVRLDVLNQYYLMTPAPYNNGEAKYEPISYPYEKTLLHKMTISPDETKIGYMKVANAGITTNGTGAAYSKSVLAIADFDPVNLVISNEVEITEYNEKNNNWYISFSKNVDKLIYACAGDCPEGPSKGQMFEYDLDTKITTKISGNDTLEYRYPAIKGSVK